MFIFSYWLSISSCAGKWTKLNQTCKTSYQTGSWANKAATPTLYVADVRAFKLNRDTVRFCNLKHHFSDCPRKHTFVRGCVQGPIKLRKEVCLQPLCDITRFIVHNQFIYLKLALDLFQLFAVIHPLHIFHSRVASLSLSRFYSDLQPKCSCGWKVHKAQCLKMSPTC